MTSTTGYGLLEPSHPRASTMKSNLGLEGSDGGEVRGGEDTLDSATDSGEWHTLVDEPSYDWRTSLSAVSWSFVSQDKEKPGAPRIALPPYSYIAIPASTSTFTPFTLDDVSLNSELVGCKVAENAVSSYERATGFHIATYPRISPEECGIVPSLNLSLTLTEGDLAATRSRWEESFMAFIAPVESDDTPSSSPTTSTCSSHTTESQAMPPTPVSESKPKFSYASILLKHTPAPSRKPTNATPTKTPRTPSKPLNASASSFVPSSSASCSPNVTSPTLKSPVISSLKVLDSRLSGDAVRIDDRLRCHERRRTQTPKSGKTGRTTQAHNPKSKSQGSSPVPPSERDSRRRRLTVSDDGQPRHSSRSSHCTTPSSTGADERAAHDEALDGATREYYNGSDETHDVFGLVSSPRSDAYSSVATLTTTSPTTPANSFINAVPDYFAPETYMKQEDYDDNPWSPSSLAKYRRSYAMAAASQSSHRTRILGLTPSSPPQYPGEMRRMVSSTQTPFYAYATGASYYQSPIPMWSIPSYVSLPPQSYPTSYASAAYAPRPARR